MMRNDHSKDTILQQSIEFSLMVIKYAGELDASNKHLIAAEVLKSGVAIGANIMAARSAENAESFTGKMKNADKEAHATWYWFYLCEHSDGYAFNKELSVKLEEIIGLLGTTIYGK